MPVVLPPFLVGDTLRVRAVWTGGNGDEIHLTDCPGGLDWLKGRGGEDLPPFEIIEDDVVDGDGAVIRGVRALPRNLLLPLAVKGTDYATWRALHQRLARSFNPLAGDAVLRIEQPDGTSRLLTCRYNGGAEGDGIVDPRGEYWYRIWGVKLRAVDPWWYDDDTTLVSFGAPATIPFFPILPLRLSRSQILGEATINLAGDVRTWGIWRIYGPADGPALLRSATLDRSLALDLTGDHALAAGEVVTVDMRPGRQAIRGPAGESWWSARSGTPAMWYLDPGLNDVELAVAGGDDTTRAEFEYVPRYLTA